MFIAPFFLTPNQKEFKYPKHSNGQINCCLWNITNKSNKYKINSPNNKFESNKVNVEPKKKQHMKKIHREYFYSCNV